MNKYFLQYQQYVPTDEDAANKEWFFYKDLNGMVMMFDDEVHAIAQLQDLKREIDTGFFKCRVLKADKLVETYETD